MSARFGVAIKASITIGQTHKEWATRVLDLANRLNCPVEVEPNEITVVVYPGDTVEQVVEGFLRLQEIIRR